MSDHEIVEVSIGKPKIEICHVDGRFFASKSDADYLESEVRICVNRQNPSPEDPQNWNFNSNLCPILAELVAVLVEFRIANVFRIQMTLDGEPQKTLLDSQNIPFDDTPEFRTKRLVVRDFWRKGYFLADGSRFGGHYLVYTASPNTCHAEYVILCGPVTDEQRIAAMRCCNQVKKALLLATTSSESLRPHYTNCTWFRPELQNTSCES